MQEHPSLPTHPSVAVVDDDPLVRTLLQEELLDLGADPVLCDNGACLLQLLKEQPIDLVLLDLMMPVMDGFECLDVLRDQAYSGAVVVVTSEADDQCRRRVLNAGAKDFVHKPRILDALPRLLSRHLSRPVGLTDVAGDQATRV